MNNELENLKNSTVEVFVNDKSSVKEFIIFIELKKETNKGENIVNKIDICTCSHVIIPVNEKGIQNDNYDSLKIEIRFLDKRIIKNKVTAKVIKWSNKSEHDIAILQTNLELDFELK